MLIPGGGNGAIRRPVVAEKLTPLQIYRFSFLGSPAQVTYCVGMELLGPTDYGICMLHELPFTHSLTIEIQGYDYADLPGISQDALFDAFTQAVSIHLGNGRPLCAACIRQGFGNLKVTACLTEPCGTA